MRIGVVSVMLLDITRTWDAGYNLAVVEWLEARELAMTRGNVQWAMEEIAAHDRKLDRMARALQARAIALRRRKLDKRE